MDNDRSDLSEVVFLTNLPHNAFFGDNDWQAASVAGNLTIRPASIRSNRANRKPLRCGGVFNDG